MDMLKIGSIIKAKRRERELTQEELANMLGVTKAAVSKWETAESYPDITMLPQIAQLFHISYFRRKIYATDVQGTNGDGFDRGGGCVKIIFSKMNDPEIAFTP